MTIFQQRLREAMRVCGLRQIDLTNKTGISRPLISSYYAGKFVPKSDYLVRLADALNVSEKWLIGSDENPACSDESPARDLAETLCGLALEIARTTPHDKTAQAAINTIALKHAEAIGDWDA